MEPLFFYFSIGVRGNKSITLNPLTAATTMPTTTMMTKKKSFA
jgi:hypothetical protein